MSSENGNGHGPVERVMDSVMIWPEPWRIEPGQSAEGQAKVRADRLRELAERFGEAA